MSLKAYALIPIALGYILGWVLMPSTAKKHPPYLARSLLVRDENGSETDIIDTIFVFIFLVEFEFEYG